MTNEDEEALEYLIKRIEFHLKQKFQIYPEDLGFRDSVEDALEFLAEFSVKNS